MRFELPADHRVRYDYHEHPHGVSAIVLSPEGDIRAVGFAKHNPTDAWDFERGQKIALGRALARMSRGHGWQWFHHVNTHERNQANAWAERRLRDGDTLVRTD